VLQGTQSQQIQDGLKEKNASVGTSDGDICIIARGADNIQERLLFVLLEMAEPSVIRYQSEYRVSRVDCVCV